MPEHTLHRSCSESLKILKCATYGLFYVFVFGPRVVWLYLYLMQSKQFHWTYIIIYDTDCSYIIVFCVRSLFWNKRATYTPCIVNTQCTSTIKVFDFANRINCSKSQPHFMLYCIICIINIGTRVYKTFVIY